MNEPELSTIARKRRPGDVFKIKLFGFTIAEIHDSEKRRIVLKLWKSLQVEHEKGENWTKR